jgi:hypothetical protein
VESKVKEEVLRAKGFRQYELAQNLRYSITTVLNMRQASLEEYILRHTAKDQFQNAESLYGLSFSDLLISNPQKFQEKLIRKEEKTLQEGGAQTRSLLEEIMDNYVDHVNSEGLIRFYREAGMYR